MPADPDKPPSTEALLATAAHVKYVQGLSSHQDAYEFWLTEHLRLNGLYWGLATLHFMNHPEALPRDETIAFVLSCQHDNGGFGAAPGHDAHMLYTVSAIQILALVDGLDALDSQGKGKAAVGKCMRFTLGCITGSRPRPPTFMHTHSLTVLQSSPGCRTAPPAPFPAMSGAKRTLASSMER